MPRFGTAAIRLRGIVFSFRRSGVRHRGRTVIDGGTTAA